MLSKTEQAHKNSNSILAGWFIDGTGSPCRRNIIMEFSDGIIMSIRRAGENEKEKTGLIDYSQYTIMPAFIDSHVHLAISGNEAPGIRKKQHNAPYDEIRYLIKRHLDAHIQFGVAAVRDGGDHKGHALHYRKTHRKGMSVITRLPGRAWHNHGRYGRFIGRTPDNKSNLAESISRDHGRLDHIKIINSGLNSLSCFGKETRPQFNKEELKMAMDLCRAKGLKIMVHANGKDPVRSAIDAGCDSIEHGFLMGKDNLKRMAEKGVTWVPTVITMKAYLNILQPGSIEADNAKRYLDLQMEQVLYAYGCGVTIATGTDSGSPGVHHGKSLKEEIRLFVSSGMKIEDSIKCATLNCARLLDLDLMGSLVPGFSPTFILIKGDPASCIKTDNPPDAVFIKGKSNTN